MHEILTRETGVMNLRNLADHLTRGSRLKSMIGHFALSLPPTPQSASYMNVLAGDQINSNSDYVNLLPSQMTGTLNKTQLKDAITISAHLLLWCHTVAAQPCYNYSAWKISPSSSFPKIHFPVQVVDHLLDQPLMEGILTCS